MMSSREGEPPRNAVRASHWAAVAPEQVDRSDLGLLPTELHRPRLLDLDLRPTTAQVAAVLADQRDAIDAVASVQGDVARAVDAITERLRAGSGRMTYVGAGTAGRVGLLDACEMAATFGTDRVLAVIPGHATTIATTRAEPEDDQDLGRSDLLATGVASDDAVVGVSASGRTPYTLAAVRAARQAGALTVGISSNPSSALSRAVDIAIEVETGPELIAGSTRLKAATAQKAILNTLSTLVMVQLGRTFGNLMTEVDPSNTKLRARASRMVADATGVDADTADAALRAADGDRKVAIVALLADVDAVTAAALLQACGGRVRDAIAADASG